MKTLRFKHTQTYTEESILQDVYMKIDAQGKWVQAEPCVDQEVEETYAFSETVTIVPGFIDTHIHGAAGFDVMDGTREAIEGMKQALPAEGTTTFLATTLTQSKEDTVHALEVVAGTPSFGLGANVAGVHLEGPFINRIRKGAQPEEHILAPEKEQFVKFQQAAKEGIRVVTLAPELDEDALVEHLKDNGVTVSMGHSDATFQEANAAFQAGVSQVTHLFNGMRGLHHRDLGVVGSVFMDQHVSAELIADGVHVSPDAVAFTYQQLGPERILLITDAMRAKGLSDGTYHLGGQEVQVVGDRAVLEDGTLAGSVLRMNDAFRNIMEFTGCGIREAMQMTCENPARMLGLFHRKGSIAAGKDADFVVLDQHCNVLMTFVGGELAFRKGVET